MTTHVVVRTRPRFRVRTALVPMVAAAVVSALAAYGEIVVVARVWEATDAGIPAANGIWLLYVCLPVLWLLQTVLIAAAAPPLALLTDRRLVATAYMALAALLIVLVVASAFFAYSLLPPPGYSAGLPA